MAAVITLEDPPLQTLGQGRRDAVARPTILTSPLGGRTPPGQRPRVDLARVKALARKLAPTSALRAIILSEPEEMAWDEYAAKSAVWLQLLSLEGD